MAACGLATTSGSATRPSAPARPRSRRTSSLTGHSNWSVETLRPDSRHQDLGPTRRSIRGPVTKDRRVGANVMSNTACRECGAYIGESAFCERCGRQRAGGLSVGGLGSTASQRLGVSYAPPTTPASSVSVALPTFSESVSAWSSESVASSGIKPPKRFSIARLLVTGALLVLAGKGAIVGYGLAKEAVEPAPLAKGDCISFDASGTNPHVSS